MGIFLKLCISINSNGASVDRTAETRDGKCLTRLPSYDNINIATEVTGNRITIEKYVISLIQSDGDKRICEVTATPA